jgi:hypothetical protein
VLLAFAIDYERESGVSPAISANVLRLLDDDPVRVRDLPALSGVSKEAISMATLVGRLPTGLTPYPDGWRAAAGAPALLPHYPMVLHPGGFPDGS